MRVKTDSFYYVVIAIFAIVSFTFFDIPVISLFKPLKDTPTYDFFKIVTNLGRAEYQIVPGLLVYAIFRKRNPLIGKIGLAVALSSALAGLSADVVKFIAGRYRPNMLFDEGLYGFTFFKWKYSYISFPSGHSATAFGAMGVLALVFRRYWLFFIGVGSLVAFSRIATLHHYASDVLVGSAIGMASSIFIVNKMKLYQAVNREKDI